MKPVLSLFPGIDMLGRGFEQAGWCVVRGPDLLWGQDVRGFSLGSHSGAFEGIIGGSPCQDFSAANRSEPTGYGLAMLREFERIVREGLPDWFLLENSPRCPGVKVPGYFVQRLNLDAREFGLTQRRLRSFQFGSLDGRPIVTRRGTPDIEESHATCLASEGRRKNRRTWADFCRLQGLPDGFDLPGWPVAFKYAAV